MTPPPGSAAVQSAMISVEQPKTLGSQGLPAQEPWNSKARAARAARRRYAIVSLGAVAGLQSYIVIVFTDVVCGVHFSHVPECCGVLFASTKALRIQSLIVATLYVSMPLPYSAVQPATFASS